MVLYFAASRFPNSYNSIGFVFPIKDLLKVISENKYDILKIIKKYGINFFSKKYSNAVMRVITSASMISSMIESDFSEELLDYFQVRLDCEKYKGNVYQLIAAYHSQISLLSNRKDPREWYFLGPLFRDACSIMPSHEYMILNIPSILEMFDLAIPDTVVSYCVFFCFPKSIIESIKLYIPIFTKQKWINFNNFKIILDLVVSFFSNLEKINELLLYGLPIDFIYLLDGGKSASSTNRTIDYGFFIKYKANLKALLESKIITIKELMTLSTEAQKDMIMGYGKSLKGEVNTLPHDQSRINRDEIIQPKVAINLPPPQVTMSFEQSNQMVEIKEEFSESTTTVINAHSKYRCNEKFIKDIEGVIGEIEDSKYDLIKGKELRADKLSILNLIKDYINKVNPRNLSFVIKEIAACKLSSLQAYKESVEKKFNIKFSAIQLQGKYDSVDTVYTLLKKQRRPISNIFNIFDTNAKSLIDRYSKPSFDEQYRNIPKQVLVRAYNFR